MYDTISRENVAAVLAELLNYAETFEQILKVPRGEELIGFVVKTKVGKYMLKSLFMV
ncbi:hypothetical protein [Planococcus antarcticus]|uniref:hypothetical protein n=1 Tax=Planococcus antarcticus TaxID=161360 RepID=UPI000304A234|nr:hypothetical protein [Planococcus antarcticus]